MSRDLLFVSSTSTGVTFSEFNNATGKAFSYFPFKNPGLHAGLGVNYSKVIGSYIYHWIPTASNAGGRCVKTTLEGEVVWDSGYFPIVDFAPIETGLYPIDVYVSSGIVAFYGPALLLTFNDTNGTVITMKDMYAVGAGNIANYQGWAADGYGNVFYAKSSNAALTRVDYDGISNPVVSADPLLSAAAMTGSFSFIDVSATEGLIILLFGQKRIYKFNKTTLTVTWSLNLVSEGFNQSGAFCINTAKTHMYILASPDGTVKSILEIDLSNGTYVNNVITYPDGATTLTSITSIAPALAPDKLWVGASITGIGFGTRIFKINSSWQVIDALGNDATLPNPVPFLSRRSTINRIQHLSLPSYDFSGTVYRDGTTPGDNNNDAYMVLINQANMTIVDSTFSSQVDGTYTLKAIDNTSPHMVICAPPTGAAGSNALQISSNRTA